jgi:hypothetical protein
MEGRPKREKHYEEILEEVSAPSILGDALFGTLFQQIVLSRKGYISSANNGVQEWDYIYILYTAKMPFILRVPLFYPRDVDDYVLRKQV